MPPGGRRKVLFGLVAGCILALAGCGGDGDRSDESKVRAAATGFYEALDLKDGARACSYLTVALREHFTRAHEPCSSRVMSLRAGPNMKGKVESVEVKGDRATVEATARDKASGGGYRDRLDFVRAGGAWKIDGVAGSGLPGPG